MNLYGELPVNRCGLCVNICRIIQLLIKLALWWTVAVMAVRRISNGWQVVMALVGIICMVLYQLWRLWKSWKLKSLLSYQAINTLYDLVAVGMVKALFFDTIRVEEAVPHWLWVTELIIGITYLIYIVIPFTLICFTFMHLCRASRSSESSSISHQSLRHKPGWVLTLQGVHAVFTVIQLLITLVFNIGSLTVSYSSLTLFDIILLSNGFDLVDIGLNLLEDLLARHLRIQDHPYAMYTQMKEALLQTGL